MKRLGRMGLRTLSKDIRFGDGGRALMAKGINALADAVAVTLGPKGRNVIIEQSYRSPKITKDGVTVAKSIVLRDKIENMGARLVQDVADRTNQVAGDGTTTATVLARAIFVGGLRYIASGVNPMEMRKGIQMAVDQVVEEIKKHSERITTDEQIFQVATVSANGDKHIGKLISKAMDRVGKEGVITVQEGKGIEDELELTDGMKLDRGFLSPYFVGDAKSQRLFFENPYVLLSEQKISRIQDILPVLELVARERRSLLVIADDVDGEALAALVLNKIRGQVSVCAIRSPGFGENKRSMLEDISVLVGGTIFDEQAGIKLEKIKLEHFGQAKSCSIGKDDTILVGNQRSSKQVQERCETIREQMKQAISEYEKERYLERIGRLSGGIAVIKVGGTSEVEVGEKKDRIVDALNATRAAVEEGIVPGGGVALLKSISRLEELANLEKNNDVQRGIRIVMEAIQTPTRTIVDNAGGNGSLVVGELLKHTNRFSFGYNALTGQYVDMKNDGIIDPFKVVRTALRDAAGVASLLTTAEAMIVENNEKEITRNED